MTQDDTVIPVSHTGASKHALGELTDTQHFRVYASAPGRVSLQIRSEGHITDHGKARWMINSTASLSLEQAIEARDAIHAWIIQAEVRNRINDHLQVSETA